MIWQEIRDKFLQHYRNSVVCTRVEMSPSLYEKFSRELRGRPSYRPTDKATGKPILGLVPKTMTLTIEGREFPLIIKRTTSAPVGSFRLDSTPLRMNPITGKWE